MEVAVIITWIGMAIASVLNTPETTVVLIDNESKQNSIVVATKAGQRTINKSGEYVSLSSEDEKPSEIKQMSKTEINTLFQSAIQAEPLKPKSFILYFETGTDVLTNKSKEMLEDILAEIKRRDTVDANIIGHTDTKGAKKFNYTLALQRAQSVKSWLMENSSKFEEVVVESYGENDLLVPTQDDTSNDKNRRVEILIK